MENQKIALVTGSNGFIGSHLSCKLVEQDIKVLGIYQKSMPKNKKFIKYVDEGKIILFQGDVTTFDFEKLGDVDYIYNIAGKVSAWGSVESFMAINYVGAQRLLKYAKKVKPSCFCQFSSVAVYGFDGYKNINEDYPKIPFKNGYSISKLKTEELVINECKKSNLDYIIIRPGNVYGEYDYTSSNEIYGRIKKEKMLISAGGKYESCFVYVENLVDAVLLTTLNKQNHNTDYNVTDGNRETLEQMFTCIANTFNVKAKFVNISAPFAKMIACLVEWWYKLFQIKKAPLITKFSVWQNCADYSFSIDKLKKIGFEPKVKMEEAVKRTVEWYNETFKENK